LRVPRGTDLNTRTILAMFLIAASIGMATTSLPIPISADKDDASNGLNEADEKVHDKTGFAEDQDIRFHEGTCQGGHPVDIPDGCDNSLITDPGESENKP
jgi:hypothetical protein